MLYQFNQIFYENKVKFSFNMCLRVARARVHTHTHTHHICSGPSIVERFDSRTTWNSKKKNSRKIQFETRLKIWKSNRERGIAQHRAAHATVSQQIRTLLVECCWLVCTSACPVLPQFRCKKWTSVLSEYFCDLFD